MSQRAVAAVAHGEHWKLWLVCQGPGQTFVMLEIGGMPAAKFPVENIIRPAASLDPGGADKDQKLILTLRQEVGDWKSKYFDQSANMAIIQGLRGQLQEADRKTAAAVSELAFLRQHVSTPEVKAKYDALVLVVVQMTGRCAACGGTGIEVSSREGTSVHRLCATCGLVRELLKAQAQP